MNVLAHESHSTTPEHLLPALNHALRSLYGAMDVLGEGSAGLDGELLDIMRRFHLAEVLGAYSIVAVAGPQGAGKSTLMRGLYDLDGAAGDWLPANEGTDEKVPVLIVEDAGQRRPQGFIRKLAKHAGASGKVKVEEVPISEEEFRAACCGEDTQALLPVLKVPPRYFKRSGAAWLLLPGYERENDANREWQQLMRQGFIGSSFFVVVTDGTRLASNAQDQMIKDIRSGALQEIEPVIVLSKTEKDAGKPEELEALRRTAAEMFGLDENQAARRIVCTGPSNNEEYKAVWRPVLTALFQEMSGGGADHRRDQLHQLEQVVRKDLGRVLDRVKGTARAWLQAGDSVDSGGAQVLKDCLDAFDGGRDGLREKFQAQVNTLLRSHASAAWTDLQGRLGKNREGILNKARNLFQTVSEDELALQKDVLEAWAKPGAVVDGFVDGLRSVTAGVLGGPPVPAGQTLPATGGERTIAVRMQQLGYADAAGNLVSWREPSDDTLQELRRILGDDDTRTGPDLRKAVRLLPAVMLENARAASLLLPELMLSEDSPDQMPAADVAASLGRLRERVEEAREFSRTIIAGLTALAATDIAEDGKLNLFGALGSATAAAGGAGATGAAGAAAANPVVLAVIAVGAVGYIAHQGFQEARQYDYLVRSHAHGMLLGIKESHDLHFMATFDDLMDKTREYLETRLRARYGMDEMLMKRDRLSKALADVGSARRGMLDEIEHSGRVLELFAARGA